MGMLQEFKKFALRGNVMDMAVGIIIGGAFGTMVKSLVDDVIMPPLGYVVSNVDFRDKKWDFGKVTKEVDGQQVEEPAVSLRYGSFINSCISFIIVAWAVFLLVKAMNTAETKLRFGEIPAAEAPPPPQDIELHREKSDELKPTRF
jgi:large conductance mechanosensitive channel